MTSNACSASSALHTVTEVLRIDGKTLCGGVGVIHHICTTKYSAKNALKIHRFSQGSIESSILNLFENVVTDIIGAIDKDLVINALCIT